MTRKMVLFSLSLPEGPEMADVAHLRRDLLQLVRIYSFPDTFKSFKSAARSPPSFNKLMTETEFNFDVRVRLEFVIERLSLAQKIFPSFSGQTKINSARWTRNTTRETEGNRKRNRKTNLNWRWIRIKEDKGAACERESHLKVIRQQWPATWRRL